MIKFVVGMIFIPFFLIANPLEVYKDFLEWGTYEGQNWSSLSRLPLSRYETFRFVFDHFEKNRGKVVVELGTSRSFNHGGLAGCNSDQISYWQLDQPETWDWGAGFFTRMAAISLSHLSPEIHTVDLSPSHIARCQIMTADFAQIMTYHVKDSVAFLRECDFPQGIDLLYLDTGDMTPIEPSALLQLEEVKVIVARNLLAKDGLILLDDVKNRTPRKFGELSDLGKSKYSLPFLLQHGFKVIMDEYQVVLQK
ncbi:MAG: hypothetical protein KBC64_01495 [Simkaniaceae bacterium]|nr:hypothetical protein [Simkaniaceae bacterium]